MLFAFDDGPLFWLFYAPKLPPIKSANGSPPAGLAEGPPPKGSLLANGLCTGLFCPPKQSFKFMGPPAGGPVFSAANGSALVLVLVDPGKMGSSMSHPPRLLLLVGAMLDPPRRLLLMFDDGVTIFKLLPNAEENGSGYCDGLLLLISANKSDMLSEFLAGAMDCMDEGKDVAGAKGSAGGGLLLFWPKAPLLLVAEEPPKTAAKGSPPLVAEVPPPWPLDEFNMPANRSEGLSLLEVNVLLVLDAARVPNGSAIAEGLA